ncbi:hypothetical protein PQU92_08720 [Asticcacaulis sp. BYS171W]|uniref:DUF1461 domain-containing protein n=1 Tax=Asticcacaulis aquaticus TaxID=2984212 RepID=A0ABT5HTG7_9CAUL|nr:hypothetical protein [Asticcacaulis aquaticus]MDC7683357.1 hypothetical protein [Asticcacaulis aquaticus]
MITLLEGEVRKILAALVCLSIFATFLAGLIFWPSSHRPDHPLFYIVERTAPSALVQQAKSYQALVKAQNWDALSHRSVPAMMVGDYRKALPVLARYIPNEKPAAVRIGQWQSTYSSDAGGATTIVLMSNYEKGVLFSTTQFVKSDTDYKVAAFRIQYLTAQEVRSVDFAFDRLNPTRVLFLIIATGLLLFSLYTLYVCLTVKGIPWGWAWALFIALGFTRLNYAWMDGTINWQVLFVGFPVSGYGQDFASSFVFYLTLPLGAALFWGFGIHLKRKPGKMKTGGVRPMILEAEGQS